VVSQDWVYDELRNTLRLFAALTIRKDNAKRALAHKDSVMVDGEYAVDFFLVRFLRSAVAEVSACLSLSVFINVHVIVAAL
jgi:hypothetical protein